ncbi:MAG TPA: hypothetical protein PLM53_01605 [Spirochaetota bacterium]|nr:hypothetical protein [Spirochaetota bacterium]HPC41107.1 hypothetical protein [Spirochaetota bacterium]HPL15529.1 hypothetical protein [Spirochaetota bacterium]HQF07028.1 hypothetical protein [Spirochaetota bacterium]HQH95765.1 hypothetical protein [Spirochaetota bacterium]
MDKVTIWYLRDNEAGTKIVNAITGLGLTVNLITGHKLHHANIVEDEINIFIFDIITTDPEQLIKEMAKDERLQSHLKFMMVKKSQVKEIAKLNYNLMHLELLNRPVDMREFLLLLEKSIIVERYREIMKFISREAESRIEAYEGLMDINRKNVFESEKEKEAFEKILDFEKNLIRQQTNLSTAIRDFTLLRQINLFDMRDRIKAEEMLADLRRKELMDARDVIKAQESVIDYSAKELDDAKKIIDAQEKVEELSRAELLDLHREISRQKDLNKQLADQVNRLLSDVKNRTE